MNKKELKDQLNLMNEDELKGILHDFDVGAWDDDTKEELIQTAFDLLEDDDCLDRHLRLEANELSLMSREELNKIMAQPPINQGSYLVRYAGKTYNVHDVLRALRTLDFIREEVDHE